MDKPLLAIANSELFGNKPFTAKVVSAGGSGASWSRALAPAVAPERQQEKGKGLKKAQIDSQVLIWDYTEPIFVDPKQILARPPTQENTMWNNKKGVIAEMLSLSAKRDQRIESRITVFLLCQKSVGAVHNPLSHDRVACIQTQKIT